MAPPAAPNRKRVDRFIWNRDYFREPTPLSHWRTRFNYAALAVAGVIGFLLLVWPSETAHYQITHGPVANPHAAWEQRCDACHVPHSVRDVSLGGFLSSGSVHQRWNEFRCETCHQGPAGDPKDYAPHHTDAMWRADAKTLACAACHRDHQGRDFSLVKLPDSDCTQCHQDLKEHHQHGLPNFDQKVTAFPGEHPEFKGAKKDFQRTLHFNHAHHMTRGISYPGDANEDAKSNRFWRIKDIPKQFRERYRQPGQQDDDKVQLNCASCHQLDAGRLTETELARQPAGKWQAENALIGALPRDSVLPPRAAGAYFLPINYEASCQACHPIKATVDEKPYGPMTLTLPHRLTSDQIDKQVRLSVIQELSKQDKFAALLKENRDRLDPLNDERRKQLQGLDADITRLTAKAKQQLALPSPAGQYGHSCAECHEMQTGAQQSFAVKPPTTPAIWYPHAKFNHAAHRAMTCASCHSEKSGQIADVNDLKAKLEKPEPIDIPGIANCQQCHAPPSRVTVNGKKEPRGGVDFKCVECHRYHNGEAPLHGLGSPLRDPPDPLRLGVDDLLKGSPKKD